MGRFLRPDLGSPRERLIRTLPRVKYRIGRNPVGLLFTCAPDGNLM